MKWFLTACLALWTTNAAALELDLPTVFSDHMVLQRGLEVPVWGSTAAGSSVTVAFGGQEVATQADADGGWRVTLDAMDASTVSRTLTVSVALGEQTLQHAIEDVLVGEVWLNGGQSNMYRPFRMLIGDARQKSHQPIVEYLRNEAATANDPLLRQFRTAAVYSVTEPQFKGRGAWSKAVPGDVNEFSGTAYFFARELRRELGVPVAFLSCNLGGTTIEPWLPQSAFQSTPALKQYYAQVLAKHQQEVASWDGDRERAAFDAALKRWEEATAAGQKAGRKPRKPVHPLNRKSMAGTLYNGMVHPLATYAMRGVIWYQGESNTGNSPEAYGDRMVALVEGWREAWGQDTLHFFWCQLASYRAAKDHPLGDDDTHALVQNGQREALRLPDTGMAVLHDVGDATDVHPKNKIDAGKRLSLWALGKVYGRDVVVSGPLFREASVEGGRVTLAFDHVGSGLMVGHKHLMDPTVQVDAPLKRFQICGPDGRWQWAEAEIAADDTVVVWHAKIKQPVEVRYAWAANPEGANLYNKQGLPASMFKTEVLRAE